MTDDSWEITIHPTDDGVKLKLGSLRKVMPDRVLDFYKDLLAVILPDHEGYHIAFEDDYVVMTPGSGLIKDPVEFANIQVEAHKLAERIADAFDDALRDKLFNVLSVAE